MFNKKKKDEEELKKANTEATDANEEESSLVKAEEVSEVAQKDEAEEIEDDDNKKKSKNPFNYSGFALKIFASAVLIAVGLWFVFDHESANNIIVTASGAAVLILCLARIVYLLRHKNKTSKRYRITSLIEIIVDLVVGVFLIIAGVVYQKDNNSTQKFVKFINNNYRFFVGSVIYLRGVIHFFETAFLNQKSTLLNYFFNIILITVGTFCFAYKFDVSNLAWGITVCILLAAVYMTQDSVRAYITFKNGGSNGEKRKKKNAKKEEKKQINAGVLDQPQDSNGAMIN